MLPITSLYAGPIALILIVLSARVIFYRRANKVSLGDSGDKSLLKRMRAQANCAEYAPMALLLLALCELQGAPAIAIHALGMMLLLGRLAHGIGFSMSPPVMGLRVAGTALTLTMLAASALGLLLHSLW